MSQRTSLPRCHPNSTTAPRRVIGCSSSTIIQTPVRLPCRCSRLHQRQYGHKHATSRKLGRSWVSAIRRERFYTSSSISVPCITTFLQDSPEMAGIHKEAMVWSTTLRMLTHALYSILLRSRYKCSNLTLRNFTPLSTLGETESTHKPFQSLQPFQRANSLKPC